MYAFAVFVAGRADKEAFQIEGRYQGEDTSDDETLSGVSLRSVTDEARALFCVQDRE
jgi:hypothetical protein